MNTFVGALKVLRSVELLLVLCPTDFGTAKVVQRLKDTIW